MSSGYEVQIPDTPGLRRTYEEIDWLIKQGLAPEDDWWIDMHSGTEGHTSFFFRDKDQALLFKLTRGGA